MSNPSDCAIGASVQVKIYNMVKYESLSVYQIKNVKSCWLYYRWHDSYLTMLFIFTCTESPIVQSAGFDILYLIYWQWFIFNHDVYFFTCTEGTIGASVQVKNIQHG
jgi:hypothetical protein